METDKDQPKQDATAEHKEETMADKQRSALQIECEMFKIARMQTEWDELNDEGSILLAALLEDEPKDQITMWLDFLAQCSFMNTSEFSRAFREYEQRVIAQNKGGDANA